MRALITYALAIRIGSCSIFFALFNTAAQSANLIPNAAADGPYYVLETGDTITTTGPCTNCIPIGFGYSFFPNPASPAGSTQSIIGVGTNSNGFPGNYLILGPLGYDPEANSVGFVTIDPSQTDSLRSPINLTPGNYVLSFDVLNPLPPSTSNPNYAPTLGVHAESQPSQYVSGGVVEDIVGPPGAFFAPYLPISVPFGAGLMHVTIPFAEPITTDQVLDLIFILGNNTNQPGDAIGLNYQAGDTLYLGDLSLDCVSSCAMPATPLPDALPLFVTGLGGLGLLGWCRKRKTQAVA